MISVCNINRNRSGKNRFKTETIMIFDSQRGVKISEAKDSEIKKKVSVPIKLIICLDIGSSLRLYILELLSRKPFSQ